MHEAPEAVAAILLGNRVPEASVQRVASDQNQAVVLAHKR